MVSMGVVDHLRGLWVVFVVVTMKVLASGHLLPTHLRPLSKYGFWQSDILSNFTLVGHEDGSQTWHPAGGFLHALDTQKACFWVRQSAFISRADMVFGTRLHAQQAKFEKKSLCQKSIL